MNVDYLAEHEREEQAYRTAVARLSPAQRDAWASIEESYEWFDGESGIALSVLSRSLARGDLNR